MGWQERAACREEDIELFFPVSEYGAGAEQVERAKAVCRGCPVREQCLASVMAIEAEVGTTAGRYGVFGGLAASEREAVARAQRAGRVA